MEPEIRLVYVDGSILMLCLCVCFYDDIFAFYAFIAIVQFFFLLQELCILYII